jgi:hypothetical protein
MKYIRTRDFFIKEAKIRDIILPRQAIQVSKKWGEKYLDYDEVSPTDKIIQGKWKLSEDDKYKALGAFTDCDIKELLALFTTLPKTFINILNKSIDTSMLVGEHAAKFTRILTTFDIQSPSLDQIVILYDSVFRKISGDTIADSIVSKNDAGQPLRDDENNLIRVSKLKGDLVFSNNLININSFASDYNSLISKCVEQGIEGYDTGDKIDGNIFYKLQDFISFASDNANREYQLDFEIFNRDIYLSISHNPKDILNMSISKFYSSCQHLYSGSYNSQLLSNVFDPNSIPAFLVFDTPIFWNDEKISDQLPLSRTIIRNIDSQDNSTKIFIDRAYPDRMKYVIDEMIVKYSGNKETTDSDSYYIYAPDIGQDDRLDVPYQDRLNITTVVNIGRNIKKLYLSRIYDWSKVRISPDVNLSEVIIDTTDIPESFFNLNLKLDWLKFRFLDIRTFKYFDKIKSISISLDKCKFDASIIKEINDYNPDIKKLQILSCDVIGDIDFSIFKNLEVLEILYTLDSMDEFVEILKNVNIKKFIISGDLVDKDSKKYINSLKSKGLKIEIVGPVI